MSYLGLYIYCPPGLTEILLAELSLLPFNTFEETEDGLNAFMEETDLDISEVENIVNKYQSMGEIKFELKTLPKENWNKTWEENYDPVIVDDQIIIKAVFHQIEKTYPYEITINPKMSFGTGHHATTYLMLRQQMKIDHQRKIVYDFGTGTGVLAIMAAKLGASKLLATDVDDWCIENSLENMGLNNVSATLLLGPIATLNIQEKAHIVLANINKNILLTEFADYVSLMNTGGFLLLSGFYDHDRDDLRAEAAKYGLQEVETDVKNQWAVLVFKKPSL
jgi:ribosomal protein L11 methyltransferase